MPSFESVQPFLDVLITRQQNRSIENTVYKTWTTTDRIPNIEPTHCSTHHLRKQEQSRLLKLFAAGGHTKSFNDVRILRKHRAKTKRSNSIVALPYIKRASDAVERILPPLDITIARKPMGTLNLKVPSRGACIYVYTYIHFHVLPRMARVCF